MFHKILTLTPHQYLFLLGEMKKRQNFNGTYYHALYTIMYAVAIQKDIPYSLEIHCQLMDSVMGG